MFSIVCCGHNPLALLHVYVVCGVAFICIRLHFFFIFLHHIFCSLNLHPPPPPCRPHTAGQWSRERRASICCHSAFKQPPPPSEQIFISHPMCLAGLAGRLLSSATRSPRVIKGQVIESARPLCVHPGNTQKAPGRLLMNPERPPHRQNRGSPTGATRERGVRSAFGLGAGPMVYPDYLK